MDITRIVEIHLRRLLAGVLQFLMIGIVTGDRRQNHITKFLPSPKNITISKGDLAVLHCGIENLGTKSVIWRFLPYTVPLTIGTINFIDDERFQVHHIPYKDEWNLLIKNAQTHDSGVYECQVSSKRRTIRQNITLNVLDSTTTSKPYIVITGTRFVEKGGQIYLMCNATGHDYPPDEIDWFKDGNKLTVNSRLIIQKKVLIVSKTIVSALEIASAQMSDTGTYVCRTTGSLITRYNVDVLNAGTSNVKRVAETLSTDRKQNSAVTLSSFTSVVLYSLVILLTNMVVKTS